MKKPIIYKRRIKREATVSKQLYCIDIPFVDWGIYIGSDGIGICTESGDTECHVSTDGESSSVGCSGAK